jgi:hypothetical protein
MGTSRANLYFKIQTAYIIILGVIWSAFAYSKGVIVPVDTLERWSPLADILLKHKFNIFAALNDATEIRSISIPYIAWISVIALCKLLFGSYWGVGVIVLNLLAGIFIAILILKVTWNSTKKPICVIFAGLAFALCYDVLQWIPVVLSEILFTSICFPVFFLIINIYQQPSEPKKRFAGILVLLGVIIFFRPSSPPLLVFAIVSLSMVFFLDLRKADEFKRYATIFWISLCACLTIPSIIFFHSYFMLHVDKWPFPFFKDLAYYTSAGFRIGVVQHGRLETYHFPPENILDNALIILHKLMVFFYIDTKLFSLKHSIINYIFYLPVYGLSIFALAQLFKNKNGPSSLRWWLIFSCASYIFMVAFFHALIVVDYDWRFRLPCIPPLIFLAALGLDELINSYRQKPSQQIIIP